MTSPPEKKEAAFGEAAPIKTSNDDGTLARNASPANLFSPAQSFCQRHGIVYRPGSYPGEIIITCLACRRGRMFLYQTWALCLACGHTSQSLASLERLLKMGKS